MLNGLRKPQHVAVFISGGGSTLQALLEMQHQIDIALIITNKISALGNLKAKRFGKKVIHFSKQMDFMNLDKILREYKIERIVLAGFMKLLPADFIELWKNKIINIHPSLLPLYPGLNSAERSWSDKTEMGATIHNVIAEMDSGEVIIQQSSFLQSGKLSLSEANLFLRRTEQFLLRELATRYL